MLDFDWIMTCACASVVLLFMLGRTEFLLAFSIALALLAGYDCDESEEPRKFVLLLGSIVFAVMYGVSVGLQMCPA